MTVRPTSHSTRALFLRPHTAVLAGALTLAASLVAGPAGAPPACADEPSTGRAMIGGYGEMHARIADESRTFSLDRLVLFVGREFSNRLRLETETELEEGKEIEVEQAYLEWDVAPRFRAQTGLVLLPVSRVNLTHEPPTFLTPQRPLFDTITVPSTWREAGVRVVYQASDALNLDLAVTNGLDAHGLRAEDGFRGGRQSGVGLGTPAGGETTALAVSREGSPVRAQGEDEAEGGGVLLQDIGTTLRATWQPQLGVELTAAGYTSKAGQGDARLAHVRASLVSFDGDADRAGFRLRATAAWGFLEDAAAVRTVTGELVGSRFRGMAAEAGYDVLRHRALVSGARLLPYVRWERLDPRSAVPEGTAALPSLELTVTTVGITWLPTRQTAVKAAMVRTAAEGSDAETGAEVGLGWMF